MVGSSEAVPELSGRRLPVLAGVLVILLLFGLLRLPVEENLDRAHRSAGLRSSALGLELREQIGQLAFVAALSGFRSLVASFLWIEAHTAWEDTAWARMLNLLRSVTTLQPRSELYWDLASWHMAWNAAISAEQDPREPSAFLRDQARRAYLAEGRRLLEQGLRNNPSSSLLAERLGVMLRDRFGDHCGAAEAFSRAAALPGAPRHVRRLAAYELAACPGREAEALAALRALWASGPADKVPRVAALIRELEQRGAAARNIDEFPPPPETSPR